MYTLKYNNLVAIPFVVNEDVQYDTIRVVVPVSSVLFL